MIGAEYVKSVADSIFTIILRTVRKKNIPVHLLNKYLKMMTVVGGFS